MSLTVGEAGITGNGATTTVTIMHRVRTKASTNPSRALSQAFEGVLKDSVPDQSLDPSLCFLNCLPCFSCAWSNITSDHWVLCTVQNGYLLQFSSLPPSLPTSPSLFRNPSHEHLLEKEVRLLLEAGAVEAVLRSLRGKGFYSRYFLIPKAKGGLRPILDLRGINKFLVKARFRMVSLGTIIPSLDAGGWYAALDMKDVYFHIAIHPTHRRFLRFTVGQEHYQFAVLPFGLAAAPQVFTKYMAVLAAFLRRQRIQVYLYLDDWLLVGRSEAKMRGHVEAALRLFRELGLLIKVPKSMLVPTQRVEFIGAVLDTVQARASLPISRFQAIQQAVTSLRQSPMTMARCCLRLLGHMVACMHVVRHARLRLRTLQAWLARVYHPGRDPLDLVVTAPRDVLDSLRWWQS
ncbi:uncharacterized protein LOC122455943 [Dermochelys coriacea]|uniref:uncharacterized protein LOC122455943 n=1 Tax=Dermochelys coriacea TaxID=27794 RepID=UPI001CA9ACF6|nr:uncharacterized protein LOC122455943 [Dermochelys coriacea]